MMSNRPIKVNRGPAKRPVWPILGVIGGAVVLALVGAILWQSLGADGKEPNASSQPAASVQSVTPQSTPEPVESEPEPEPEPPKVIEGALPETERVKSDYFDDAVFVGDSITTGIELYGVMANADVLAGTGINLDSLYSSQVVKQEDGTRITIVDGLRKKQYAKMYVMLGGNEVRDVDKAVFLTRYGKVLDDLRLLQPDATIYVQSILPVTQGNKYNMSNSRIDEYNLALIELCAEKQVYYLNVAEKMKDAEGKLPTEASPADGMHFGPDYYQIWFNYLKTHVAGMPPAPPKIEEEQATISSSLADTSSSKRDETATISNG